MATRKRDRALERVPDGIFPADRAAPFDPGALHKFLLRGAPLTVAQSRALVVEANKGTRINLKTAKAFSLTIPPTLLLRADQVIE